MVLKTDVLVIGGGSAGLHAAIEAQKHGVNVILVNKAGGNATIMAAGGFAGNFNLDEYVSPEEINLSFIKDILDAGRNLNNRDIVAKLVECSGVEINNLKEQGVHFYEKPDGDLKLFQASGHSYPRTVRCSNGNTRQYYSILREKAVKSGVNIINNVCIIDLIKRNKKVCGAVGIYQDKPMLISCSSIILATGGISANYTFSTHRKGIQGNGLTMALKAGASLIDMEFIQFMPTVIAYPEKLAGLVVTDTLRGEGAILLNKDFERFMERYSPVKKDMETRDNIAKSIFQEIYDGRGTKNNTVYIDARNIDRERIKESFTNYELLMKEGIDPKKDLIEISPAAHYTCGGIKIDDTAFTGVEGLWACGEVTGGLHGANRLGSVALTENIVFGKLAGENAALYSLQNRGEFWQNKSDYSICLQCYDRNKYESIVEELRFILSNNAGIVRNEDDLLKGLRDVEDILSLLQEIKNSDNNFTYDPLHLQIQSFALITYCILKSSQMRKESRGTHFRKDYPKEKDIFLKSIVIKQENGETSHYLEPVNNKVSFPK